MVFWLVFSVEISCLPTFQLFSIKFAENGELNWELNSLNLIVQAEKWSLEIFVNVMWHLTFCPIDWKKIRCTNYFVAVFRFSPTYEFEIRVEKMR